ncbi:hypothetical protein T484DRAFT_2970674 [Baffinella frigidus]|nr:hypothetical protein T484DRAFT_2970674 [Cryptophyta sp. CCMP2293]
MTKVHSGVGKDLSVFAILGGLAGSFTKAFTYDKPQVDNIAPRFGPTSGAFTLTVTGVNFGEPAAATLGGTAGTIVGTTTSSTLKLLVPEGTGVNKGVTVDISTQIGTSAQAFSYTAPTVSAITPAHGGTSGGFTVTVRGSNFGNAQAVADGLVNVTIGPAACSGVTSATPHSAIECIAPEGAGTAYKVQVTVDAQVSPSLTQAFSYDNPLLTAVSPRFGATIGGTTLTLRGDNFGAAANTRSINLGDTSCALIGYTSHTQITCVTPPGVGIIHKVNILVSGLDSSATSTSSILRFSYLPPEVVSLSRGNGPKAGNVVLTISGEHFGTADYNPLVKLGGSTCTSSAWTSDSSVSCTVPPGMDVAKSLQIEVDTQVDSLTKGFTYDAVLVTEATPRNSPTSPTGDVTVFGVNFGTFDPTPSASIGNTASSASAWITQTCSGVIRSVCWVSDSQLVFRPPYGAGVNLHVSATVLAVSSSLVSAFTYDLPTLTAIGPSNGITAGGTLITLYGSNFGTSADAQTATFAGATRSVTYFSHLIAVISSPAGTGVAKEITINIETQVATAPSPFCYDAPRVTSVKPSVAPQAGGGTITIYGDNFGVASQAVAESLTVNGAACGTLAHPADGTFTCTVAANVKTNAGVACSNCNALFRPVSVTVDTLTGTLSSGFSYSGDGSTQALSGLWCQGMLTSGQAASDGVYWIDPDGDSDTSDAFQVYCLQTTDGGGWTKVLQYEEDPYLLSTAASGSVASTATGLGKLSDANIALLSGGARVAVFTGTLAASTSGTSFTLGSAAPPFLNWFLGRVVTIGGVSRIVTAYSAGRVVTVTPAFASTPAAGASVSFYRTLKEYRIRSEGFTTQTDNLPEYTFFVRSARDYSDSAFGQGLATGTSHAISGCLTYTYATCGQWKTVVSPGYLDTLAFGFASGQPGASDTCSRYFADYAGGPNYCFGHFVDSTTFTAASSTERCFVTGACAEGAIISKGVMHTYLTIYVREYHDTNGVFADST